jgi:hypothetical protein
MTLKSFCRAHCGYFTEGAKVGGTTYGYGCRRYSTAAHCPVGYIKGASVSGYEITFDEGDAPIILDCAKACCPDPSVRLAALGEWPVESLDTLRSRSALGGEGGEMVARVEELLKDLQIGAKDDASDD